MGGVALCRSSRPCHITAIFNWNSYACSSADLGRARWAFCCRQASSIAERCCGSSTKATSLACGVLPCSNSAINFCMRLSLVCRLNFGIVNPYVLLPYLTEMFVHQHHSSPLRQISLAGVYATAAFRCSSRHSAV